MNRKSRSYIGLFQVFVVLGVLLLFTCQGFAGVSNIYKWKDDQGKVYFTDDPMKIPLRYRSGPGLETKRGLPPPKSSLRKSTIDKTSAAKDQEQQGQPATDSDADNKEQELTAMQEALNFLKSDVQRYKKYEDYFPEVRHARLLKNDIVAALPAKEALEKKLGKYDSALLKDVKSFLKKSLLLDYKAKDLWPRRMGFIAERSRLTGEIPEKNSLIGKLEKELASAPEITSPKSKPTKPAKLKEPVKAIKKKEPKTLRAYGG